MEYDTISFGSALIDMFAYTDVKEVHGEIVYPVGTKIQIKNLYYHVGGGGINTSTTFSRLGLKAGLLAKVGNDNNGKKILDFLKKEKIDFLGKINGETGCSIVLDSKEHDRTILTYKASSDCLEYAEIPKIKTKWIYFSSLLGKSFLSQVKLAKIYKKAKIAFNPSAYMIEKGHAQSLIKYADILILNKEEADMINRDNQKILSLGPSIIIVTDGSKPFFCYTSDCKYKIYPHHEKKAVERTGAGDAFASGFVAGMIKLDNIEKALQIGVANSESVIKYLGSTNKILSWDEVLREIKRNPCKIEKI